MLALQRHHHIHCIHRQVVEWVLKQQAPMQWKPSGWLGSWAHFFCYFSDRCYAGAIQVAIVLSCLYKQVILYVFLHLFPRCHKVIVTGVHFVVSLGPRCVCWEQSADLQPVTKDHHHHHHHHHNNNNNNNTSSTLQIDKYVVQFDSGPPLSCFFL